MLKNTPSSYGTLTKFFHWLMALLLICMFIIGFIMINIESDYQNPLFALHKATGLLLFTLVAIRLVWRWINPQPAMPAIVPPWQRIAAKSNIVGLYLCMFFMPITGFLTSTLGGHDISFYNLFTISPLADNKAASDFFAVAHEYISYFFMAIFSLHVLGSFYHHYYLKDEVLERMTI